MGRVIEVMEKVVALLEADATLTGLLATTDAIYRGFPEQDAAYPCVTWNQIGDQAASPDVDIDEPKTRNNLVIQVSVWAVSQETANDVCDAIDDVLRCEGFATTNYRVLWPERDGWLSMQDGRRDSAGAQVWHFPSTWTLQVNG